MNPNSSNNFSNDSQESLYHVDDVSTVPGSDVSQESNHDLSSSDNDANDDGIEDQVLINTPERREAIERLRLVMSLFGRNSSDDDNSSDSENESADLRHEHSRNTDNNNNDRDNSSDNDENRDGPGRITLVLRNRNQGSQASNRTLEVNVNNGLIWNLFTGLSMLNGSLEIDSSNSDDVNADAEDGDNLLQGFDYRVLRSKFVSSTYFDSPFKRQIPNEPTKFNDFGQFADNMCYIFKVLGIYNALKPSEPMLQFIDKKWESINGVSSVPTTTTTTETEAGILAEILEMSEFKVIEPPATRTVDGKRIAISQNFINHCPLVRHYALDLYYKDRIACKYEIPCGLMFNVATSQNDGNVHVDLQPNGELEQSVAELDPDFETRNKIAQKLIENLNVGEGEKRCSLCFDEIFESQQYIHFDKFVDILAIIENKINKSRGLLFDLELKKLMNIELD
ncbi:hypothetical protein H4219_005246 [Mycoemilia scoparia]|uniref:Uncharacterized protein n=1 Tax=Mycoemilia scoparia TaxID=417184 RepID=A0A9W7ZVE4_9FUNG|nr:hypothetical protein H4219_005246 [Mycoemilia scoparia]